MKKGFFPRLAAQNLRKNASVTLPYFITLMATTAIYYNIRSLSLNPGVKEMFGGGMMRNMLTMGSGVAAVFAVIFLFYSSRFVIRRRTKEFGVFNILGMEKRHLAQVLFWENLYLLVGSLASGLVLGIALDKLLFLLMARLVKAESIPIGFFVSGTALANTAALFGMITLLVWLSAVVKIRLSDPIRLVQESKAGETEPRTNWLLAVLGVLCTAGGYAIALTTKDPLKALPLFFVAVLLVIAGTYCLFMAGSIALLKTLRRSKSFYYKPSHFVSISGLLYRMKQNAAGLASICVLSTMVLVMISGTGSLMVGTEDALMSRHPYQFVLNCDFENGMNEQELEQQMHQLQTENQISIQNETGYHYLVFPADNRENAFLVVEPEQVVLPSILMFMPLSEYNAVMGTSCTLSENEIAVYADRVPYEYSTMELMDKSYTVKQFLDAVPGNNEIAMNILNGYTVVVPDFEFEAIAQHHQQLQPENPAVKRYFYGFDTGVSEEQQRDFYYRIQNRLYNETAFEGMIESRAESRTSFISLYGGFFFVGIFLGALFLMATVLIIYYKQISEGWEDRERYSILRKVGMDSREGKRAIRSQILIVFFLPLAVSFCHVAAAFPLVKRLLAILNLTNVKLYLACTGIICLVFAAFYLLVYSLTAKTYYKIVSRKQE